MAACSAREVDRAMKILGFLEEPVALDVYDAGYEWVRHMLLEAWVETKADDRWKMGPFVDLLTSLKLRTGEPIQTAVPQGGHQSLRDALVEKPSHVRVIQDRAIWLAALAPDWGAVQFSLRFILSNVDYLIQDPVLLHCFCLRVHLSGDMCTLL